MERKRLAEFALERYDNCRREGLSEKESVRNIIAFVSGAAVVEGEHAKMVALMVMTGALDTLRQVANS